MISAIYIRIPLCKKYFFSYVQSLNFFASLDIRKPLLVSVFYLFAILDIFAMLDLLPLLRNSSSFFAILDLYLTAILDLLRPNLIARIPHCFCQPWSFWTYNFLKHNSTWPNGSQVQVTKPNGLKYRLHATYVLSTINAISLQCLISYLYSGFLHHFLQSLIFFSPPSLIFSAQTSSQEFFIAFANLDLLNI